MSEVCQPVTRSTVIAGAASGIGRKTSSHLAALGHNLVLLDLNADAVDELKQELRRDFRNSAIEIESFGIDLSSENQVRRTTELLAREYDSISGLVNCAGGYVPVSETQDVSLSDWNLVVGSNLTASFLTMKYFFPLLKANCGGAAIVNVASNAARSTATSLGPEYTAAKAGVIGLTRHAAKDWAPYGIRVNAIAPGPIRGQRLAELEGEVGMAKIAESIPLRRLGEANDMAAAISFLLSSEASFITGATLDVNGGIFMG